MPRYLIKSTRHDKALAEWVAHNKAYALDAHARAHGFKDWADLEAHLPPGRRGEIIAVRVP